MVLRILSASNVPSVNLSGQTINLCSGVPRTIRSMAEMIQQKVGSGNLQLGAVPYRSHEMMSFYGSTKKFDSLFGEFQHTPIEEALAKTIEFYRTNNSIKRFVKWAKSS